MGNTYRPSLHIAFLQRATRNPDIGLLRKAGMEALKRVMQTNPCGFATDSAVDNPSSCAERSTSRHPTASAKISAKLKPANSTRNQPDYSHITWTTGERASRDPRHSCRPRKSTIIQAKEGCDSNYGTLAQRRYRICPG